MTLVHTGTWRNLLSGREPSETEDSGAQPSPRSRTHSEETHRVQNLRGERTPHAEENTRSERTTHTEESAPRELAPHEIAPRTHRTKTSPHRSRARLRFRARGTTPRAPTRNKQRSARRKHPSPPRGTEGVGQKSAPFYFQIWSGRDSRVKDPWHSSWWGWQAPDA